MQIEKSPGACRVTKQHGPRIGSFGETSNCFGSKKSLKQNLCCKASMRFSMCLVVMFSLVTLLPAAEPTFDSNGNIVVELGGSALLTKDDIQLLKGKDVVDSIDWRVRGAPALPGEKFLKRSGVNGILQVKTLIGEIPDGARIEWECVAKDMPGKTLTLSVLIPAEALSSLPNKLGTVVKFGTDKKGDIRTGGCLYHFDLSESNVDFAFAGVEDFRKADWLKKFRLTLNATDLKSNTAKIVLKITQTSDRNIYNADLNSPFLRLPIAQYGNRTLTDQVENDGKGGWTDQGTNDMSVLTPGVLIAQGIPFDIGDKAIILRGRFRQSFPEKSPEIPVNEKIERFAFCHTAAWCGGTGEAFHYLVKYADGTTETIPVIVRFDVADWAAALPPSARVRSAWNGASNDHVVHLAHMQWHNPKKNVPVRSIQVISGNRDPVACVLGISAVKAVAPSQLIRFLDASYSSIEKTADVLPEKKQDWYECNLPLLRKIEPGSALDVSFLNDAPAGKYGFVKKVGSHFEFEKKPGEKVVFWGTNVAYPPAKEHAVRFAETLAGSGINIVRIHMWQHCGRHPSFPEIHERNIVRDDGSYNMETLDKWHFFIAECIKRGIYIYMDTYDTTTFLRKLSDPRYQPEANEELKALVKLMYCSKNPYTGKTLAADPALAMCEIMNENSCTYGGDFSTNSPEVQKIISSRWEKWQKERGISPLTPIHGTPMEGNGEEGRKFFAAQEKNYLDEMYAFLRKIGVKAPICGTNLELTAGDLWASQNMDFMNDHTYYGSSSVGGGYWQPLDTSVVNAPLSAVQFFNEIIHSRLSDKPVVCTEWSFVYPNVYRQEGYPFTAAFTAYQGIDAMFSFDWASSYMPGLYHLIGNQRIVCLSQVCDPSTWGLNQAAAVAVLRGDIKQAQRQVTLKYSEDDIWANRRQLATTVSFLYQMARVDIAQPQPGVKNQWPIGTDMNSEALYNDAIKKLGIEAGTDYVVSDTKELIRFANPGLLLVDTPKSQFAIGALYSMNSASRRKLSAFGINSPMKFATLTFTSLDNLPLKSSRRILCCAVGNSANEKAKIDRKGYDEPGKGPVLTEPVYAEISAQAVSAMPMTVYKIDPATGKRLGKLAVTSANGLETFNIDKTCQTMYFELVR